MVRNHISNYGILDWFWDQWRNRRGAAPGRQLLGVGTWL